MHLFVIPGWFTAILFVALAVFAIWKGGRREIVVAVALAVEMLVSIYLYPVGAAYPMWRLAVDDGLILVVCLACLVRADRYWCVWACSFALLGEISDLTIFAPGITHWASFSASLVWSYAIGAAVLWGVLTRRVAAGEARRKPSR
jgi:hypothetical protein